MAFRVQLGYLDLQDRRVFPRISMVTHRLEHRDRRDPLVHRECREFLARPVQPERKETKATAEMWAQQGHLDHPEWLCTRTLKTPPGRRIVTVNRGHRVQPGHGGHPGSTERQGCQEKPVFQVTQVYRATKASEAVPVPKGKKDPNSSSTKMPHSTHPGRTRAKRANGGPVEGVANPVPSGHQEGRPVQVTWAPTRGRDDRDRKEIKDQKGTSGPAARKAIAAETEWMADPVHRDFQQHRVTTFSTFQCPALQDHQGHRVPPAYQEFR